MLIRRRGASWSPARSVRKPIIGDFIQQLQSYSLGALTSEILTAEVVQVSDGSLRLIATKAAAADNAAFTLHARQDGGCAKRGGRHRRGRRSRQGSLVDLALCNRPRSRLHAVRSPLLGRGTAREPHRSRPTGHTPHHYSLLRHATGWADL